MQRMNRGSNSSADRESTLKNIGGENPIERRGKLAAVERLAKQERLIEKLADGLSEIIANVPPTEGENPSLDERQELGSGSLRDTPHLGRASYVEFVLQIARLKVGTADAKQDIAPQDVAPKASQIYSELRISSIIKKIGVTNIISSFVLKIDPGQPRKQEGGRWTSSRTKYRLHHKVIEAWRAAKALKIPAPKILAEIAVDAHTGRREVGSTGEGNRRWREEKVENKICVGLRSAVLRVAQDPSCGSRQGRHQDLQKNNLSQTGKSTPQATTSTSGAAESSNGFGNGAASPPTQSPTELSDRDHAVDISAVDPPLQVRCNRMQWEWLVRRTQSLNEQWLVLHLIDSRRSFSYTSSSESNGEGAGWTVVSSDRLYEDFGVRYPTEDIWKNSALIEAKRGGEYTSPQVADATDSQPQARELRVKPEALETWMDLKEQGGDRRYKAHRRELDRTSKPVQMSTDLLDENDNEIPSLVKRSLEVLANADHRGDFAAIEEAEKALMAREGAKARHQLTTLRMMKETIERQIIDEEDDLDPEDSIVRLKNAYRMQKVSGRVSFKGGGPQGLHSEVKARFYDLEDYRNYDIAQCHTSALEQVAEILSELGTEIDVSPWKEYPGKQVVAKRLDVPVSLVKFVEHAVKYGAALPASIKQVKKFYVDGDQANDPAQWPAVPSEIYKRKTDGQIEDMDRAVAALREEFADLRDVVIDVAEALLTDYYSEVQRGGWMKNACGVAFGKHTCDEGFDRRSTCMAWMLQGLEAAFCHSLTISSAESEAFSVVANEHDGLIVRKETSSEERFQEALSRAIAEARDRSGFHLAEFEEKPFADEDEVAKFYGEV